MKENGKLSVRYGYDKLNRLIREDNAKFGTTTLYAYDNNGNILSKRETEFTLRETEQLIDFSVEKEYIYDVEHTDRLISYGDEKIGNYDTIGNPAEHRGKSLTWQKGRQLARVTDNRETITFTYDANGRRIQKFASGVRTKYAYAGNQLIREERGDENNIPYFGDDLVVI